MEFWEGAILVAGGILLVKYMSTQKTRQAAGFAAMGINSGAGTSNESNATNITNMAGGYPTVYGEDLEPPQPPVGPPSRPVSVSSVPVPTPVRSNPILSKLPTICPAWGCGAPPPRITPVFGRAPVGVRPPGTVPPVRGTLSAPVAAKAPATPPAPTNPYAKNPIFGPLAAQVIARQQPTYSGIQPASNPKVTFTQATSVPARPIDQHMMLL